MFLNELLTLERPKLTPGHSLQPPTNVERALLVHFPQNPRSRLSTCRVANVEVVVLAIHSI